MFVARNGCLRDYFDIVDISSWYDKMDIHYNDVVFDFMCETEMIELLSGGYRHPVKDTSYSPIIDFAGDDVLWDFRAT